MIRIAWIGFAVGLVAYVIALATMDELASDIGNAVMLITAVLLLFRLQALLESGSAGAPGSGTEG
jgi:hypothetical protein